MRILGPLDARREGAPLDLGAPRQRIVLAVLAASAGQPVSLDDLIQAVWGTEPPPRATASLQAAVSNLRRVLEPDRAPRTQARLLVTRLPGYALDLPPGALDAARFEGLADAMTERSAAGDEAGALAAAEAALAHWRGDVLADFPHEPFALALRQRLGQRRLQVQEERAALLLDRGRLDEALAALQQITGRHPTRERAWELTMLALYRAGRPADALRAFQEARASLTDGRGAEPGPDLRRLEQRILDRSPSLDGLAAPTTRVPDRVVSTPPAPLLTGRDAERAKLARILATTSAGRPTVTLISGEAGIGKTSLVEGLPEQAATHGATVHLGRSLEHAASAPLWPWTQVVASLLGPDPARRAAELLGPRARHLGALLPEEGLRSGEGHADIDDAPRLHLFAAVRSLLGAMPNPVVIVLDDLHWADVDSLRLLDFLAAELAHEPVALVATFRSDEAAPGTPLGDLLASLARHHPPERIELRGIDARAVAELSRRLATELGVDDERAAIDAATATALEARTSGNPFYVAELVRLLVAERHLDPEGVAAAAVPAGVRDVVRRRVDRLPAETQYVLRVAALLGQRFRLDELAVACDLDLDAVIDALEPALVAGVIVEPDDGGGRLSFSHALVAATLTDDLPATRRRRLHARIGAAIEAVHAAAIDGQLTRLAFHYAEAAAVGHAAVAASYAERAARQAEQVQAPFEAARLWQVTADVLTADAEADRARVIDVQTELARALIRVGDARARAVVADALDNAHALGDIERGARAAAALIHHATTWTWADYRTVHEDLVVRLERLVEAIGPEDSRARAMTLGVLACGVYYRDVHRAYTLAREAVEIARRLGDEPLLAQCLASGISNLQHAERIPELEPVGTELIELGRRHGNLAWQAMGHAGRLTARLAQADLPGADADAEAARALLARHPLPELASQVALYDTLRRLAAGDLEGARTAAARALELSGRSSMWSGEGRYLLQLLDIHREEGTLLALEEDLRPYLAMPRVGVGNLNPLLMIERGDLDGARRWVRERGIERPTPDWRFIHEAVLATDLATALGEVNAAADLYDLLLPFADRLALSGSTVNLNGPVAESLGRLAVTLGRPDEAVAWFSAALAMSEKIGSPLYEARARLALAEWLPEPEADDHRRTARALASSMGLTVLERRADELQHRRRPS